ncbi:MULTISPECIES: hypothetical protein [Aeromicrobium]|uniref:Uncharacterized protein n=1 Tax=Aeromicrobium phoceense TaxID=2754045 RepID=A0A838XFL0_9ACTN|nr:MULTISPECIES: hypothetical protein [Aeromicrobium]MBA4607558.1 hypothetical protein [Aeromicrobium phoceense]
MTTAYLVTSAVLLLSVLAVRHHRPAVSVPVVILVLSVAAWNLLRALRGPDDLAPSLLVAVNVVVVQVSAVSFFVAARRLVHGRWVVAPWLWIAAAAIAALSFAGMVPALGITDGDRYYDSPVYAAHLIYAFGLLGAGVLTLSTRQHDPSRHVRRVVLAAEVAGLFVVSFQVLVPALTPLAIAAICLVLVWTTSHVGSWSRSASRADRLMNSIGVFIFVIDRAGRLQDWNGPAASLLRLMGRTASHGMDLTAALSMPPRFVDGATVTLFIQGGELRTALSVHSVDPLARDGDLVLMFRPVRSSVEGSSFPTVSGALKGHDPGTQTLGRKAALEVLRTVAAQGGTVIRLVVTPRDPHRTDEVMFLIARRMEARAAEAGFPDVEWARLDTWTFVTELLEHDFDAVPGNVPLDDLGVDMEVTFHTPLPGESSAAFIRRVSDDAYGRDTAHGS